MQTELVKKALKTGGKAIELGVEAERMKQTLVHGLKEGWEDGLLEAKRSLKRGRYAAEDLLDETSHRVKQNPWRAVGITLGLGFGLGTLIGIFVGRSIGRCGKEE